MTVRRIAAASVLAATAAAVLTFTLGGAGSDARTEEKPTPVAAPVAAPSTTDLAYAHMMIAHHAQAVRMSRGLVAKPAVPERVRAIAEFIASDQQREIDEMTAWLDAWGQNVGRHEDHAEPGKHGMLTETQLADLDAAPAKAATPKFLQLMIEHHTGAIGSSRTLLDEGKGRNTYIHTMAKHVINEQSAENDAMRALLPGGANALAAG
ncbi:DUF305 domain-containing protein [Actinoplanes sp. NPDC051859]|uniref:DUF305 domain-containing protein n=1 Tax=Actinoplanes sp. NPDC051859 TaxID=3363909 RepID=UPI0037A596EB